MDVAACACAIAKLKGGDARSRKRRREKLLASEALFCIAFLSATFCRTCDLPADGIARM